MRCDAMMMPGVRTSVSVPVPVRPSPLPLPQRRRAIEIVRARYTLQGPAAVGLRVRVSTAGV